MQAAHPWILDISQTSTAPYHDRDESTIISWRGETDCAAQGKHLRLDAHRASGSGAARRGRHILREALPKCAARALRGRRAARRLWRKDLHAADSVQEAAWRLLQATLMDSATPQYA